MFPAAAAAKLADREALRGTLAAFGLPRRALGAGVIMLPIAEVAAAALLLPVVTARIGAVKGGGNELQALLPASLCRGVFRLEASLRDKTKHPRLDSATVLVPV